MLKKELSFCKKAKISTQIQAMLVWKTDHKANASQRNLTLIHSQISEQILSKRSEMGKVDSAYSVNNVRNMRGRVRSLGSSYREQIIIDLLKQKIKLNSGRLI